MKTAKKSSRKQRRKQTAIVISVAVLIAGIIIAVFVWNHQKTAQKKYADDSSVSSVKFDREVISHNGKEYRYNEHLSNFLFMGIDTRNEVDSYETQTDVGQADSIFLVSLDRMTNQIKIVSIPRDTMTKIEVFNPSGKSLGETTDHINIQYAYGDGRHKSCDLMRIAVSNLLGGIPIEGYCSLNMDGIPIITEIAGNIEVVVPDNSLAEVNPEFTEGASVTLTKDNVEQFVRYRDINQELSALVRQNRQKVFLDAYLKKAQENYAKDASFVTKLYEGIKPYTVTSMGNDFFAKLLEASMGTDPVKVELPGKGEQGAYFDEYHVDEEGLQDMLVSIFYQEDN